MDIFEAIQQRHSVRAYDGIPLSGEEIDALVEVIARVNHVGDLDCQILEDPQGSVVSGLANYGRFEGVRNYIAMIGPKGPALDEKVGYFGEKIVLAAQMMGVQSCWVGLYSRSGLHARLQPGHSCRCIIAVGHGQDGGSPHRVKDLEELCTVGGRRPEHLYDLPRWFTAGLEAAQLAPTALNQQKFTFDLLGGPLSEVVRARTKVAPYAKVDLGIAKYHFEVGANAFSTDWVWAG